MGLSITGRQVGDVLVVGLDGRLTLGSGSIAFRDVVRRHMDKGEQRLIIDLWGIKGADSSGIHELKEAHTYVTGMGRQIKLLNLTRGIKDTLQLMELAAIYEYYDDLAEAVRSFR